MPAKKQNRATATTRQAQTIADQLRQAIIDQGLSGVALNRVTVEHFGFDEAVSTATINRFLTGERDIRLETAAKLATVLRLRLTEAGPVRGRGRPKVKRT